MAFQKMIATMIPQLFQLIKKTLFTLMLPQHSKIAAATLYSIVDQIWFLAGDNSTNFNFYTKRAILAQVLTITNLHWLNNDDLKDTISVLDKQLKLFELGLYFSSLSLA